MCVEEPEEALALLQGASIPSLRVSQEVAPWIEARRRAQERKLALRQAGRKLKMAALLGGGGLLEEEREALLQAGLWLGKALGVENRVPEPGSLEYALRTPHAHLWGDSLPIIRTYASDPSAAAAPAAAALRAMAGQ